MDLRGQTLNQLTPLCFVKIARNDLHAVLPHRFFKKVSYVSLQSALAHYGMIPEYVLVTTSVTITVWSDFESPGQALIQLLLIVLPDYASVR